MADTIKDYLIGFGFDVDESGAGQIESMLEDLDSIVRNLGEVLTKVTGEMTNFMSGLQQQSQAAGQSAGQIDQLTGSAQDYSGQITDGTEASNRFTAATREVGKAASETGGRVNEAKESVKSFREESDKAMPAADNLAKSLKAAEKLIKIVAGSAIIKGVTSLAKSLYEEELALTETAKKLHKTTEEARAHNNAIKAIGKTYEEIKKDKKLKATYDELVKIGESMALPEGEAGVDRITEMVNSFNKLKMVGSYALNWLFYSIQKLADGPLQRMKETFDDLSQHLQKGMPKWSMAIGNGIANVMQLASAFVKAAVDIVKFLDTIPTPLKVIIALVGALEVLIKTGTFGKIIAALTIIGLLLDDFYTYIEGGESLLGPFWEKVVPVFEAVKDAIENAGEALSKFWEESKNPDGMVNLLLFGIKAGTWIVNGLNAGLGSFADKVKAWITGSEDASWEDVGTVIVGKIATAISGALDAATQIIEAITGLINTNLSADKVGERLTNAADFAKGIFNAIIDAIPGLGQGVGNVVEAILGAITALLNTVTSDQFAKGLTSLGTNLIKGIAGAIETVELTGSGLIDKIVGLVNDGLITEQLPALLTNASSFAASIVQAIIDEIPKLGESTKTLLTSVVTGLATLLNGITSEDVTANLGGLATTLITGLGTAIGMAFSSAGDIVSGIATMLRKALEEGRIGDMLGNLGGLGTQIIAAIGEGIKSAAGGAASFIEAIGQMLAAALNPANGESVIGDLSGFGQSIVTAIVNAIGSVLNGAEQIFTAIGALFEGIEWDKVGTDLGQLATGLVDKLIAAIGGEGVDFEGVMTAIGTALGKAVNGLAEVALNIVNALIDYMLDPGSWVRLGEGLLAIVRGAFKGVLAFLDEALGGNFVLNTDEQVEQINNLADSYQAAKEKLESLDETSMDYSEQQGIVNAWLSDLTNAIQNLSEEDLSGIGTSIAGLISQIESGEGTPEEIEQWKASLQSYLELMQTVQELTANGQLAPNNMEGANIEGSVTANIDGVDNYDQVIQQIKTALEGGGPVPAEVEVTPEVKVSESSENVMEDSITEELEKTKASASPTVEMTDVTVEAGDGNGVQEATQEAVDNILSNQKFSAAVTVQTSVNVEVSDSNAETIGTDIGTTIGGNVASGLASVDMFTDMVTQASAALDSILEKVGSIVSQIVSKFGSLPGSVGNKFRSVVSSAKSALNALPPYVKSIVDKINQYISQIKSPKITTPSLGSNSEGGVIDKETVSRLGEGNKREYVIPVTKPNRAVPLLKRAAADLGLSVQSYANATKMLGGSGSSNVTPAYASGVSNNSTAITNNKSVNAPATINVYGSDARQTANLVEKNQEQLLLRNIKAAFA